MKQKPTYIDFNNKRYQKLLSTKYVIRGETGVLSYPYSKKIVPHWRFKTPQLAQRSANKIYQIFLANLDSKLNRHEMFIRADICRKFLQMGYTRSMRYYYHRTGKKWEKINGQWQILPNDYDPTKKISANIFKKYLHKALGNKKYIALKKWFIQNYT